MVMRELGNDAAETFQKHPKTFGEFGICLRQWIVGHAVSMVPNS